MLALQKWHGSNDIRMLDYAFTYEGVLEAVMAGNTTSEILSHLRSLPFAERQTLLCTLCSIRKEIADSCRDHGEQISQLLTSECLHFVDGHATCRLGEVT